MFISVHIKTNVSKFTQQHNTSPHQPRGNASVKDGDLLDANIKRTKLAKSYFNITNMEPQIEMLDDIPKHMEGNKDSDRSASDDQDEQLSKNTYEISSSEKNVTKVRPETPSKVREMFERISPRSTLAKHLSLLREDLSLKNCSTEMSFSDSDSDILDDNDFEVRSQGRYQHKNAPSIQESSKKSIPGNLVIYFPTKRYYNLKYTYITFFSFGI